jgi:hypothetical protein
LNTDSFEDLDKSVEYSRKALQECEKSSLRTQIPLYASNLGRTLHFRFLFTGSIEDLAAAMENAQKAVDATPEDHWKYDDIRQLFDWIMQSVHALQASNTSEPLKRER